MNFMQVRESANDQFVKEVNVRLKEGWQLYGAPFIDSRDGSNVQALTKPIEYKSPQIRAKGTFKRS